MKAALFSRGLVVDQVLQPTLDQRPRDPTAPAPARTGRLWLTFFHGLRVAGRNSVLLPGCSGDSPGVEPARSVAGIPPARTHPELPAAHPMMHRVSSGALRAVSSLVSFGSCCKRMLPACRRGIVIEEDSRRPLLAILPTGGGKSPSATSSPHWFATTGAAFLIPGDHPLQALMKDQVDNLASKNRTP